MVLRQTSNSVTRTDQTRKQQNYSAYKCILESLTHYDSMS